MVVEVIMMLVLNLGQGVEEEHMIGVCILLLVYQLLYL